MGVGRGLSGPPLTRHRTSPRSTPHPRLRDLQGHYRPLTEREFIERFYSRLERRDGCLLWTGAVNKDGYGVLRYPGLTPSGLVRAHILSWFLEQWFYPLTNYDLDHLCFVRACCELAHLRHVQKAVNRRWVPETEAEIWRPLTRSDLPW